MKHRIKSLSIDCTILSDFASNLLFRKTTCIIFATSKNPQKIIARVFIQLSHRIGGRGGCRADLATLASKWIGRPRHPFCYLTNKNMKTGKKSWHKTWWGIILTISFWPFVLPYLMWQKTTWPKPLKIGITAILVLFFVFAIIDGEQRQEEALQLVKEAETLILENRLNEASNILGESMDLFGDQSSNPAFELEKEISQLSSQEFLEKTLVRMTDKNFELLKKDQLTSSFLKNDKLNELFLERLKDNMELRTKLLAEKNKANRKEMIEKQFSVWDGSHIKLTRLIKAAMNDPDSYDHVSTTYSESRDFLIIVTQFRGNNAFGAKVKQTVKGKASIDGEEVEILVID